MNSNETSFNVSYDVSTSREEIMQLLTLSEMYPFVRDDKKFIVDQVMEVFGDEDYHHSFLDEGGRFWDDGAYLEFVLDCVLDLHKEEYSSDYIAWRNSK